MPGLPVVGSCSAGGWIGWRASRAGYFMPRGSSKGRLSLARVRVPP
ncbi:hypothetical protein CGRA01v4_06264 [Colletotrichum graminicola]|nr:hypothetical protein CGRA01v4_06264 [Colletotrichum graminicola]